MTARPVLILPGYDNSGPGHWQSLWENTHSEYRRVQQRSWTAPVCDDWYMAPDDACELARAWGSRFVLLERGGHVNADAGFGPWPEGERLLAELTA